MIETTGQGHRADNTGGTQHGAPAGKQRMPRAQRERQMLEVAEVVFAEHGYAAASMDEIAEQVGVSKPMLYEYFGSKEGLLLGCIRQSRTELRDVTMRAAMTADTAEQAMREGLRAFFQFINERDQSWALLRHEMLLVGTSASEEIEVTRKHQTDMIASVMRAHAPEAPEPRLAAFAEFVVGGCERLAIWCEAHDDVTPDVATEYAMNLLWSGFARHAGEH